jgi:major membrane immunogen (membrane-anchored lipoprotein)
MKYTIPFIMLTLLLVGCGRRDAEIQQQVTGTWVVHYGGDIRSTNIIRPDGGYSATVTGFPDGHRISIAGSILAKGGDLIETITTDSDTNQALPMVVRGHIIRLDDHQLVAKWDAKHAETTIAQKVEP